VAEGDGLAGDVVDVWEEVEGDMVGVEEVGWRVTWQEAEMKEVSWQVTEEVEGDVAGVEKEVSWQVTWRAFERRWRVMWRALRRG
jgi:hypothetical protein